MAQRGVAKRAKEPEKESGVVKKGRKGKEEENSAEERIFEKENEDAEHGEGGEDSESAGVEENSEDDEDGEDLEESEDDSDVKKKRGAKKPAKNAAKKPAKGKRSAKADMGEIEKRVLEHLVKRNRPNGPSGITAELQHMGSISQATVKKALQALASQNKIMEKASGKSAIYCPIQKDVQENEDTSEMEQQIKGLEEKVAAKRKALEVLGSDNRRLESEPTNEQLLEELAALNGKIAASEESLAKFSKTADKIDPKQKEQLTKKISLYQKELKKRKSIFKNITAQVLEGSEDMTIAKLFAEAGIDEETKI